MNSDERACPWCAETIKVAAVVCRFCNRPLPQPEVAAPVATEAAPTAAPAAAPTATDVGGRLAASVILGCIGLAVFWGTLGKDIYKGLFPGVVTAADMPKVPPPKPRLAVAEPEKKRSPAEEILEASSLGGAIAYAKPRMADTQNGTDAGTALLAIWMSGGRAKWASIATVEETTIQLVQKDSDLERGKRLCAGGMVVQITGEKMGAERIYTGKLMTDAANVVSFVAVASTGDLVAQRPARFCGIVTGRDSYSNAGGGTTHAVRVVGMFDLPENRKP